MTVLERHVARPIRLVFFPVADKCETLCNVAEDGRLDVERLDINQHRPAVEEKTRHLFGIIDRHVPLS